MSALLLIILAVAVIGYWLYCMRAAERSIRRWADEHGYRLLEMQVQLLRLGPYTFFPNRSRFIYRVEVEKPDGVRAVCWARANAWHGLDPSRLEIRADESVLTGRRDDVAEVGINESVPEIDPGSPVIKVIVAFVVLLIIAMPVVYLWRGHDQKDGRDSAAAASATGQTPAPSQEESQCRGTIDEITPTSIGPVSFGMTVDQLLELEIDGEKPKISSMSQMVDLVIGDKYRVVFDSDERVARIALLMSQEKTACVRVGERVVALEVGNGIRSRVEEALGTCGELERGAGGSKMRCEGGWLLVVLGRSSLKLVIEKDSFEMAEIAPICDVPVERRDLCQRVICPNDTDKSVDPCVLEN